MDRVSAADGTGSPSSTGIHGPTSALEAGLPRDRAPGRPTAVHCAGGPVGYGPQHPTRFPPPCAPHRSRDKAIPDDLTAATTHAIGPRIIEDAGAALLTSEYARAIRRAARWPGRFEHTSPSVPEGLQCATRPSNPCGFEAARQPESGPPPRARLAPPRQGGTSTCSRRRSRRGLYEAGWRPEARGRAWLVLPATTPAVVIPEVRRPASGFVNCCGSGRQAKDGRPVRRARPSGHARVNPTMPGNVRRLPPGSSSPDLYY